MKNQCYVFAEDHVNLVAFFAVGNMPSYTVWNIRHLPKDAVYQGVALKAWTFEFTEQELKMNWLRVVARSDILADAILAKVPVHRDVVLEQLPFNLKKGRKGYWQCKKCQLDCYLKDELNGG